MDTVFIAYCKNKKKLNGKKERNKQECVRAEEYLIEKIFYSFQKKNVSYDYEKICGKRLCCRLV